MPSPSGGIDWTAVWKRGQEGWPRRFPLAQFPNAPLLVFIGATVTMRIASGDAHDAAWAVSRVALTVWAYEELVRGSNSFRRVLGAAVLVGITVGLAHKTD